MFFCAISGEPPQEPVVSAKSGRVYERRLILKYITSNGTDPITGDKLEEADLITITASTFSYTRFVSTSFYVRVYHSENFISQARIPPLLVPLRRLLSQHFFIPFKMSGML